MLDSPAGSFIGTWLSWTNASQGRDTSVFPVGFDHRGFALSLSLLVGGIIGLYFTLSSNNGALPRNIAVDILILALFFLRRVYTETDTLHLISIPWLKLGLTATAASVLVVAIAFRQYAYHRDWISKDGLILPCETYHIRTKPKKHEFRYSYLFVWIPVWTAAEKQQDDAENLRYWMFADARDHLYRGDGRPEKLRTKLERYLRDEEINPDEYTAAYLVTAPTILGHQFNPVSFWYLYKDNELSAMVLEVNNTFDERRMYFLDRSRNASEVDKTGPEFRHSFAKDFHVSPFNSRKGGYKLNASDPFLAGSCKDPRINNKITLISSDGEVKFFASVSSVAKAVDPAADSPQEVRSFFAKWWWTGKVTYLRILREAFRLFFARRLHVWFRPEVKATSIGRSPTAAELRLEQCFELLLKDTVRNGGSGIVIDYKTVSSQGTQMTRIASTRNSTPEEILRIDVLSPDFFSRIVRYEDVLEGLLREMSWNKSQQHSSKVDSYRSQLDLKSLDSEDDKTISVSSADLLIRLFDHADYPSTISTDLNPIRKAAAALCRALRYKPKLHDKFLKRRLHALDKVTYGQLNSESQKYTRDSLESILSARLAFGDPTILWIMIFLVKAFLSWEIIQTLDLSIASWSWAFWNSNAALGLLAVEIVRACI